MRRIVLEKVCKAYAGKAVLRDVSLTLEEGKPVCLMGPSGAGKTTLTRILLGLEKSDSGTVTLPEPCRFAAVFQEDRLLEGLSAEGNLRFILGRAYERERSQAMLDALALSDAGSKSAGEYSGGMKRRLSLSRALLAPSDALVLDEPFAGLDRDTRRLCLEAVRTHASGKLLLLVTHEPSDADALGASVYTLAGSGLPSRDETE